ncbi:hypothetical protein WN48_04093 [Eufriesea mexicana]|uniref:Protein brambleberry n=1 Tax=Eufriesea mexicana TaxID=516756 RepID=A0A310SEP8_9HYME|nr:hypothetical protein WN48_04093 [Eufriesea mexicana]
MVHARLLIFFCMLIIFQSVSASLFGWIWGKDTDDTTVLVADGVPLISIPYESMTKDEKFLQEAAKFTDIQVSSPLQTCQHKVIMKIKTSCSEMTEEELAKLSVNLLNCQSAVEGRKMFPCTDEMTLKQCTTEMDADMWNAYHLMSNRARAVCYVARSTQFRALTELSVNKLMQTVHTQIKTLGSLQESQNRLEEQTIEALASLSEGNKALLEQQKHLKNAQASAHNLVTTNLRELTNEKALIRLGHTQLAAMADDIKKKLEEAHKNLEQQSIERNENHQEILEDLSNIQEHAQLIWNKIELSTNRIFAQHEEALVHYEQTLEKLNQINDTIQYIWNITNNMRVEIDEKLNWLTDYIGDTGEQMYRMYRISLHIVYLLFAMVIAAFLNAPLLTRIIIIGIVPLNLISYLKHGMDACLDFISISVLIFLITIMHFLMIGIQRLCGPANKKMQPTVTQINNQNGRANEKFSSLIQSAASWSRYNLVQREELSCSYIPLKKTREDLICDYKQEFPSMSEDVTDFEHSNFMDERNESIDDFENLIDANDLRRRLRQVESFNSRSSYSHQSPSRSVTPLHTTRILCNAITRSGRKCRLNARSGQSFCGRHSAGTSIMGD